MRWLPGTRTITSAGDIRCDSWYSRAVSDRPDPAESWLADAKTEEAARARTRRRWLATQATENATMAGALADLADADQEVVVGTLAGSEHRARVAVVGTDVVWLHAEGRAVLVALAAVAFVRAGPGAQAPTGDRPPASITLLGELERLRDDGEDLTVRLAGARTITGRLEAVGVDVLTLRAGTGPGARAYVPFDARLEVEVVGSG